MPRKKRKKVGRKIKYETRTKLSKAVTDYFSSISFELPCTDDNGEPIYNLDGEEIVLVKYIVPPSVQDLCLFLRIDRKTFENYSKREEFADICEEAKLRIEAYLTEQLNTRDRPQGIMFNLENNFGWKKKNEVELGEGAQEAIKLSTMTIDEKSKLLADLIPSISAYAQAGTPDEYDDKDE